MDDKIVNLETKVGEQLEAIQRYLEAMNGEGPMEQRAQVSGVFQNSATMIAHSYRSLRASRGAANPAKVSRAQLHLDR